MNEPITIQQSGQIIEDKQAVENTMKNVGVPGMSVASASRNGLITTIITEEAGHTDASLTAKVSPETVFGVASLSKPLFAYLVLKLIEANDDPLKKDKLGLGQFHLPEGLTHFDLDTPLYDILPMEGFSDGADISKIKQLTARMVLSHRTGLPNDYPLTFDFNPGTEYGYSGIAIDYLQKVIERMTQPDVEKPGFEALVKKYVFDPLKMSNSTFIADKTKPLETHASNSLRTTAADYAKFVVAWMYDENEELKKAFHPIYSPIDGHICNMTEDEWAAGVGVPEEDLKHVAWGLGWGLEIDNEGNAISAYHSGDMNKWRAWVAMDLKAKTAIVYFTNSDNENNSNGHILADQILSHKVELKHSLNYFFKKYGFARKIEDNWQNLEKSRFEHIGQYLKKRALAPGNKWTPETTKPEWINLKNEYAENTEISAPQQAVNTKIVSEIKIYYKK